MQSQLKIYVGGEVGTPGTVPYREGLTGLQAVMERGGFRDTAQWDLVALVRMEKDVVRMKELGIDEMASKPLIANDVIFVPKTGIAKVILAVRQYIRDMLPFSYQVPLY